MSIGAILIAHGPPVLKRGSGCAGPSAGCGGIGVILMTDGPPVIITARNGALEFPFLLVPVVQAGSWPCRRRD
jgi:hypothetical protein